MTKILKIQNFSHVNKDSSLDSENLFPFSSGIYYIRAKGIHLKSNEQISIYIPHDGLASIGLFGSLGFPAITAKKTAKRTHFKADWYWQRCGKSEEAHGVMKNDLAGGKLPSGSFGENAAWWWCMILAFNLNALMKGLVLRGEWKKKRIKAIRYGIINIPARIIRHSRELIIQLSKGHPSFTLLNNARERLMELGCVPAG